MSNVRVYTTTNCAYCVAAKAFLSKRGIPFEELDVTGDADKRVWLLEQTKQRTVPQIFIGDRSIGGYTDLVAAAKRGEIDGLGTIVETRK